MILCVMRVSAQHAVISSSASSATQQNPVSEGYTLQPGDAIQITVYRQPDLTTSTRLGSDGMITFPLIGRVAVGGMNIATAQQTILKRLADDYLVNPQVSLTVLEYTKKHFTLLGQVAHPGAYDLPNEGKLTLLEAIGLAGGYTDYANPSRIVIKRRGVHGKDTVIKINAEKMAKEQAGSAFEIQPGDAISVPQGLF